MYKSFLLFLLVFTPVLLCAQNFWREIAEPNQADYRHEEKPSQFKTYQIDFEGLTQHLAKAPKEEDRGFGESLNMEIRPKSVWLLTVIRHFNTYFYAFNK